MNDWERQSRMADSVKKNYHKGDRILINNVADTYGIYQQYEGQVVTVESVDDMGQIHCRADNGGHLAVCSYYGDNFSKVEPDKIDEFDKDICDE